MDKRFGTALNCIDGRTQLPVIQWMKQTYGLDYIDMITEPGMDFVLSQGIYSDIYRIESNVMISISAHDSKVVVVAGHYDCAANPVSSNKHIQDIIDAVYQIKTWGLTVQVVGLWIDENWKVQVVAV